ncbi:hypothetical protein [Streptomyces sp. NPDC002463]|uniref:hypothetical protein n=1 Tax=Streptomyces sp. NPDC002463 TaxID=3364645 RepID=UPI0036C196E1
MIPADGGDGGGGYSGTNFRAMDHQTMLAWLDEASSYYVGDAADVLRSTGQKLTEMADRLVKRMKDMDWEGEAEKAFSEWALSVAKSTSDLGTYSDDGAYWMDGNATAIGAAASAIPRYTSYASAKANLEAAIKYHNDPDAQTVAREAKKASDDLAAIEGQQEANRLAAAAEMERLSSTYSWNSQQMSNQQPPTFPPPPGAFVPRSGDGRGGTEYIGYSPQSESRSTGTDSSATTQQTRSYQDTTRTTPDTNVVLPSQDTTGPTHVIRPEVRPDAPVDLGIDSTDTLPHTPTAPTTQTPGGPPPITKPDGGTPPFVTTGVPPLTVKGGPGPLGPTSPLTGGTGNTRNPLTGGLRTTTPNMPREGISGGRAVPSTTGRPQTGIPRSTVIGNEPTGQNRTGMGRAMGGGHGMGGPMGGAAGQNGISGGRRLAGETGGVVGGRAQRAGVAGAGKPFTAGGSGLVRGNAAKPDEREEQSGERPDYLVEDEETWQQGRRVAPPVID